MTHSHAPIIIRGHEFIGWKLKVELKELKKHPFKKFPFRLRFQEIIGCVLYMLIYNLQSCFTWKI